MTKYYCREQGRKRWRVVHAHDAGEAAELTAEMYVGSECRVEVRGHGQYRVDTQLEYMAFKEAKK